MQVEQRHFVDQLLAAWNSHDGTRVARLCAPTYEGMDIAQRAPIRGPAEVQAWCEHLYAAFPDAQVVFDAVIAEENRYAIAWTAQGTHRGRLFNMPPTAKLVQVRGMSLLTVEAGQVVTASTVWDMAGLLRAIGLLPQLLN
jgi:steroid delta-isomerase-like uncharacterized protein